MYLRSPPVGSWPSYTQGLLPVAPLPPNPGALGPSPPTNRPPTAVYLRSTLMGDWSSITQRSLPRSNASTQRCVVRCVWPPIAYTCPASTAEAIVQRGRSISGRACHSWLGGWGKRQDLAWERPRGTYGYQASTPCVEYPEVRKAGGAIAQAQVSTPLLTDSLLTYSALLTRCPQCATPPPHRAHLPSPWRYISAPKNSPAITWAVHLYAPQHLLHLLHLRADHRQSTA